MKIRIDRNVFLKTNTLAYVPVMKKKVLKPVLDNASKLFSLSLTKRPIKPECLSLTSGLNLVLYL